MLWNFSPKYFSNTDNDNQQTNINNSSWLFHVLLFALHLILYNTERMLTHLTKFSCIMQEILSQEVRGDIWDS